MSVLIAYCNVKQYVDIIRLATALEIGACTNKYGKFYENASFYLVKQQIPL
jgi:hypothetical protein